LAKHALKFASLVVVFYSAPLLFPLLAPPKDTPEALLFSTTTPRDRKY
jgi:hypothetical protein